MILDEKHKAAGKMCLEGYIEALAANGITQDPSLIIEARPTYRSGLDAAEKLLSLTDEPTAIFAMCDVIAAAVVAVAHNRGLNVPSDLTVCGFGDSAIATTIWPELTTICQSTTAMTVRAIGLLTDVLTRRDVGDVSKSRHVLLPYKLVRRQSDAAPRRRPAASRATEIEISRPTSF